MNISKNYLFTSLALALTICLKPITGTNIQWKKTINNSYGLLSGEKTSNLSIHLNSCSSADEEDDRRCPLWNYCNKTTGKCLCGNVVGYNVKCDVSGEISVIDSYCITYNNIKSTSELGQCIFSYYRHKFHYQLYQIIPTNASQKGNNKSVCHFNRQGTLCGSCKPDHHPLAFSYNLTCVRCASVGNSWWMYIMLAFLPLTAFYLFVLLFQISVLHSNLEGYVFYCQIMCFPTIWKIIFLIFHEKTEIFLGIKVSATFFSIWNLDWLRPFSDSICFKYSNLVVNSLDLTVALYPLLLILITYMLIKLYDDGHKAIVFLFNPIHSLLKYFKVIFEMKTSLVDAFSTFFLLSSVKLISVAFYILTPVKVYFLTTSREPNYSYRLYSDASIPYFGRQHLPYVVVCLSVLLVFVIIPGLVLILYPFSVFQHFLNKLPLKLQILMHTFLDTYFGSYKDGTKPGSWDCRWFGSLVFVARILLVICYGCTLNVMGTAIASMLLIVLSILLIVIQPYKSNDRNYIFVIHLLCLAGFFAGIVGTDFATLMISYHFIHPLHYFILFFTLVPLVCTVFLAFNWIFQQKLKN